MNREKNGITLLGLGPGDISLITRNAWQTLLENKEVYLRTKLHPAVKNFPEHLAVHSFDDLYNSGGDYLNIYDRITEEVLRLGERPEGVVYAVPGHPFVAETTSINIYHRARKIGLTVRVVEGISFIESTMTALGIDPFPQLSIVDALELASKHTPGFPPDTPALIGQIYSRQVASETKLTLMEVYPNEHLVKLVHNAGTDNTSIDELPLYMLDRTNVGMFTSLYIPPLEIGSSFESFQEVISHLRAPDGCPWDREQTHRSLRPHLLEEAYETLTALDNEDYEALQEELGDLLLQIVLHVQIANEHGDFTMAEVIKSIHEKIIRRHPHVFGTLGVEDIEHVLINWETFKAEERKDKASTSQSILDGVALSLPALAQADQYQSRAARAGFNWPDLQNILDKIKDKLAQINWEQDDVNQEELGNLLFAVSLLARHCGIDAESALRTSNERFRDRFAQIEKSSNLNGKKIRDLTQEERKSIWQ